MIHSDPIQMVRLLESLIESAVKFHRPTVRAVIRVSGRITATEDTADTLRETGVDGNGIGFRPKQLNLLFEAFQV